MQQLMPNGLLHGGPLGRVERNSRLKASRILVGADELGQIELASAVYTAANGRSPMLKRPYSEYAL